MRVFKDTNVNQLLPKALMAMKELGIPINSRNGMTLEFDTPVTSVYLFPKERVLFNEKRDANPFFHFMESLWMLAGRNDTAFPSLFNSKIGAYSDDGTTFHGAYGWRIRKHFTEDQFTKIIYLLKTEPDTRRAVISIWDPIIDLTYAGKDTPCNDMIMFKIRNGKLNMTVCNRSNDLIWGCYGANAVHFSYIMEYVANKVGVPVGVYNQVSDSLHVYTDNPQWELLKDIFVSPIDDPYDDETVTAYPLGADHPMFEEELHSFVNSPFRLHKYTVPFFKEVAQPMAMVWQSYKQSKSGLMSIQHIKATDWQLACRQWLVKRENNDPKISS